MAKNQDDADRSQTTSPVALSGELADDLIGTVYVGRYELVSEIGSGGMGVIYKARQIFLDRTVAVKMLKNNFRSAKALTRFHQEAKAASALNHPGIVSIQDFGVDELDRPYMVMEYVEGCTLSDLLLDRLTLPMEDLLPVVLEICDALSEAHKKCIVHRDLKPNNIMLVVGADGDVRTKLLDFGIAKMLDMQDRTVQDLTKTGDTLGTPLYMSPEQIESKNVTPRSDLYSLGCTLYACLTGAPPFIGETKIATMDMHCSEQPLSLKEASCGLDFPVGIEPIVMRLLEKRPEDRFDSVDQLKKALIAMAVQNGLISRPDNPRKSGDQPHLDSATTTMSKSISDTVHKNRPTQTVSSDHNAPHKNDERKDEAKDKSSDRESRQTNTLFWEADLPDRIKAARGGKFQGLPRRADHYGDQKDRLSSRLEGSLNRTFAIVGCGLVVLVLALVRATTFSIPWKPHRPQLGVQTPTVNSENISGTAKLDHSASVDTAAAGRPSSPADSIIDEHLRKGAMDSSLSLRNQEGLTEKGVRTLAQFKLLRNLDLGGTHLNDAGVKLVTDMPLQLINLDYNGNISDWSLLRLSHMPTLKYISLVRTGITDKGLRFLASSHSIFALCVGGNHQLTGIGIKNLSPAKSRLESIFLNDCDLSDASAEDFLAFKYIRHLNLAGNPRISDRTIGILQEKAKNFEFLSFADDYITDIGINALTQYKKLSVLDLSGIKLSHSAVADLAKMKHLNTLYIADCGLTTEMVQELEKALTRTKIETTNRWNYHLELK